MQLSELMEGSMSSADVDGVHILLARLEGGVFAVSGTCTHQDTDLGLGFLLDGRVVCPLHLSQFDLKDGKVMNAPATVPLRTFNVKIEGETIFVEI
jgi:3-phenylpropionate/trans-cinnamate dioxygenase ferredoxin component